MHFVIGFYGAPYVMVLPVSGECIHMRKKAVASWNELKDRQPAYALTANVDLVVIRYDENVSVLYGRCLHRGALLSDGHVRGHNLICGLHDWDYRYDTGVSEYANKEVLKKFSAWIENGEVCVDEDEIALWEKDHPQPYNRDSYLGLYAETHSDAIEPFVHSIQSLGRHGLKKTGHHGAVAAMGVPRDELPQWSDIQILTAQLHKPPLLDDEPVGTDVVIGANAQKPLRLRIPLFVSDMSFGSLSASAKIALARGAEMSGTGICSGEGGMLAAEQESNSRYFLNWRQRGSDFHGTRSRACRPFISRADKEPRPGPAAICPATRCRQRLQKCAD